MICNHSSPKGWANLPTFFCLPITFFKCVFQKSIVKNFYSGRFINYPIQDNLRDLIPEEREKALNSAEAREIYLKSKIKSSEVQMVRKVTWSDKRVYDKMGDEMFHLKQVVGDLFKISMRVRCDCYLIPYFYLFTNSHIRENNFIVDISFTDTASQL